MIGKLSPFAFAFMMVLALPPAHAQPVPAEQTPASAPAPSAPPSVAPELALNAEARALIAWAAADAAAARKAAETLLELQRKRDIRDAVIGSHEAERARHTLTAPIATLLIGLGGAAGGIAVLSTTEFGGTAMVSFPVAFVGLACTIAGAVTLRRALRARRAIDEKIRALKTTAFAVTPDRRGASVQLALRF